jgi:hypothetical protein
VNRPGAIQIQDQAKAQGIKVKKGLFPSTASGRAITNGRDEGALGASKPLLVQAESAQPAPPKRPGHCLWAGMIARIDEALQLLCPLRGGQVRIIAFITHSANIRQILDYITMDSVPPRMTPGTHCTNQRAVCIFGLGRCPA